MEKWEKITVVQRMQDYIRNHINEKIKVEEMAKASGYSKRHAIRIFKELLGRTPLDYIKAIRLTNSAKDLLRSKDNILNITILILMLRRRKSWKIRTQ